MPRRDGAPTEQEIAAQRAGQGPPPPNRGGALPPREAAVAALLATAAAARTAATAPPVIAPALTIAAINAAAAGIIGSFGRFLETRRQDQEQYVMGLLEAEVPDLPEDQRLGLLGAEMDAEKQFAAKARGRLDRDLPKALSIVDPGVRETQVQKILDRERRYFEMRESAMATRTLGTAEQQRCERLSPEGGFWRLSPHVREHTLDCLAMGNKVWPHSVLRTYHPPLHGGCPCEIWTIQEAQNAGLITSATQYATPDQSLYAMQVVEAEFDREEFEDELAVLETAKQLRWWRGTGGPGQFRSPRGDLGAGLRRSRAPRTGQPAEWEAIRSVDAELDLQDVPMSELATGDQIVIGGELDTIKSILAPGVVELEAGGLVRLLRDHVLAARGSVPPADPLTEPTEAAVDVTEAAWEREHRTRSGEWSFTDPAHATEWAMNEFGSWHARLAPEHQHSLAVYKGDDAERYRQINRALRGRDEWTRDGLRHAPLVHDALMKHRLSEPVVVHRAVPLDDLPSWPPNVGEHLNEPGFMSTSLVPSVPEAHYNDRRGDAVFMHLGLPAGTPAGFLDPLPAASEHREILLPPGVVYRVESTHVDDHGARHLHATVIGVHHPAVLRGGHE